MKKEKVSFIIPAYNAQKYILDCVTRILQIPYEEIEVIVVDDGSTDLTLEKLKTIIDHRLMVVSQKNSGVSAARNTGIRKSTGNYIAFVDADDLVLPEQYSKILNSVGFDKEIYMFAYAVMNQKIVRKVPLPLEPGCYNEADARLLCERLYDEPFSKNYKATYFGGKVYQYLFSRKFLLDNELAFPTNMRFAEDCIFCFSCFRVVKKFEVLAAESPYLYVVYSESASHSYRSDFWNELKKSYMSACNLAGTEVGHKNELYFHYGNEVVRRTVLHFSNWNQKRQALEKIREVMQDQEFLEAVKGVQFDSWTFKERMFLSLYRKQKVEFVYLMMRVNNIFNRALKLMRNK
ncbi:glycosyltransferase family 2 protein [Niallia circulans]|uniref:Glycosyltransferase 2-like domain-containing protein n=1 Tax=Niallia circulans TaxID=1397 RepID=A0AA91YZB1_NIACI|nr:glycosyltransferase family 2 protein [Niallia circulans]PAD81697.1 hypothetical protein CHH57_18805 [Niallia circulans]